VTALGLSLYRLGAGLLEPLAHPVLSRRAYSGKEDPTRLGERYGQASLPRPNGVLIWIHAASMGESQIALGVAEGLTRAHAYANVLITSGTRTSAQMIKRRALPRVIHQFPPVDIPRWVSKFLEHWRPNLAVFIESELWPNLIMASKVRRIPLALINARMNEKSLENWERWPNTARTVIGAFDWIGTADEYTRDGLSKLYGLPVPLIGNLKLECNLPDPDNSLVDTTRTALENRPVYVAASTHVGEEKLLTDAHLQILRTHPDALMILAPRHPSRSSAVCGVLDMAGMRYARRSAGEMPQGSSVWLADTLGEMSLWYTLCPVAVIGGSFKPGVGGHNPVEASRAGAAVITGPYTEGFKDIFSAYDQENARFIARSSDEVAEGVRAVWTGGGPSLQSVRRALNSLPDGVLTTTLKILTRLLEKNLHVQNL